MTPRPLLALRQRLAHGLSIVALLLGPALASVGLRGQDDSPTAESLDGKYATVGILRLGFVQVSENDAKAAVTALTRQLGTSLGYQVGTQLEVFDRPEDFGTACREGRVQIILVGTFDLLDMKVGDHLAKMFVAETAGRTAHAWRILVRSDSGLRTLADLRGKRVLVLHNGAAHMGWPWIETLCLERHLGLPARFFGSCELVGKASSAALPVFFSKADACIVDEVSFSVLGQLNPQIASHLVTLEVSPVFSNAVVALTREGWRTPEIYRDVAAQLPLLEEQPAGRQLLTLFRCDRLVPASPDQLASVTALHQLRQRLIAEESRL